MVRIPSFTRRSEAADSVAEDRNRDGRIDERDQPTPVGARTDDTRVDGTPVESSRRSQVDDRGPRAATATGTATETKPGDRTERFTAPTTESTTDPTTAPTTDPTTDATGRTGRRATGTAPVPTQRQAERAARRDAEQAAARGEIERTAAPAGPKPRASLLATLGLVLGVTSALVVLTGLLAGYGIALAIFGLLLSIGGLSATGKRHVAGKSDALLGIALNVGAMVIGGLALTGALPWLTTEMDKVDQFRQWLDSQFATRI